MLQNEIETLEQRKNKFHFILMSAIFILIMTSAVLSIKNCYKKSCDNGMKPTLLYPDIFKCICVGEPK